MADQRGGGIAWTEESWNPIRGCSRVSAGCERCYAMGMAARFSGPGQPYEGLAARKNGLATWTGQVAFVEEHLYDPLRWKRPRRIFVNSMSDLFHEKLRPEDIAAIFAVMACAPRHTFQVLTKRSRIMRELLNREDFRTEVEARAARVEEDRRAGRQVSPTPSAHADRRSRAMGAGWCREESAGTASGKLRRVGLLR